MGSRGPVPKRTAERLGHVTKAQKAAVTEVEIPTPAGSDLLEVTVPAVDENWHPIAQAWYESLADSGQARFYEPSDWQVAFVWAELLSRQLSSGEKVSAMMMTAWNSVQSDLLVTEGARRRVRLEFTRVNAAVAGAADAANVTLMDKYRDALA